MLTASMAEENISSLEKFKTYFEEGCDLQSCDGFGLKVILRVALGDGKNPYAKEPYLAVLDFLLEMDDIPRIDKIDALELAGAILLSHDGNHAKFALAFHYWRRALSLRLMDAGEGPIYKALLQYKNGQLSEWCSLEDLQRIEKNPAEREMQSLLVRLRIFAGLSWRAAHRYLFLPSITSITQFLRKGMQGETRERSISQVLDIAYIFVDTLLRFERPHQRGLGVALLGIVELLIHTFNSFQNQSRDIIRFLVHLGASPYARDVRGNGVFHNLAFTGPEYGHDSEAIARFLLDCAHGHGLDMVDEEGMTAADVWFQRNTPGSRNVGDLPNWLQESQPKPEALKCLSAAAIRRHKIHYGEGDLPAELLFFLLKH